MCLLLRCTDTVGGGIIFLHGTYHSLTDYTLYCPICFLFDIPPPQKKTNASSMKTGLLPLGLTGISQHLEQSLARSRCSENIIHPSLPPHPHWAESYEPDRHHLYPQAAAPPPRRWTAPEARVPPPTSPPKVRSPPPPSPPLTAPAARLHVFLWTECAHRESGLPRCPEIGR